MGAVTLEETIETAVGASGAEAAAAADVLTQLDPVAWPARIAVLKLIRGSGDVGEAAAFVRVLSEETAIEAAELLVFAVGALDEASAHVSADALVDAVLADGVDFSGVVKVLVAACEFERIDARRDRVARAVAVLEEALADVRALDGTQRRAVATTVAWSGGVLAELDVRSAARVLAGVRWCFDDEREAGVVALRAAELFAEAGMMTDASAMATEIATRRDGVGCRARGLRVGLALASGELSAASALLAAWDAFSPADEVSRGWLEAQLAARTGDVVRQTACVEACCEVISNHPDVGVVAGLDVDVVVGAGRGPIGMQRDAVRRAARALAEAGRGGRGSVGVLAACGDVAGVEMIVAERSRDAWVRAEAAMASYVAGSARAAALWSAVDEALSLCRLGVEGFLERMRCAEVAAVVGHPRTLDFAHAVLVEALAGGVVGEVAVAADLVAAVGCERADHVDALLAAVELCADAESLETIVAWLSSVVAAPVAARARTWRSVSALLGELAKRDGGLRGLMAVMAGRAALPFDADVATTCALLAAVDSDAEWEVRALLREIAALGDAPNRA